MLLIMLDGCRAPAAATWSNQSQSRIMIIYYSWIRGRARALFAWEEERVYHEEVEGSGMCVICVLVSTARTNACRDGAHGGGGMR